MGHSITQPSPYQIACPTSVGVSSATKEDLSWRQLEAAPTQPANRPASHRTDQPTNQSNNHPPERRQGLHPGGRRASGRALCALCGGVARPAAAGA
eukprot:364698-Chlamydomonas_euryale.AAC.2